jgi:hypothetical protein
MVTGVVIQPCWKGNIDISPLSDTFDEGDGYPNVDHYGGLLQGGHWLMNRFSKVRPSILSRQFKGLGSSISPWCYPNSLWSHRPESHPFVDVCRHDMESVRHPHFPSNPRQTTSPETHDFFETLLQLSPRLPDNSYTHTLLLTTTETNILIIATLVSSHSTLLARALHPISLLTPSLTVKRESPSPPPPPQQNPFQPSSPQFVGQFISVVSPQRISAREASCSQFDAKLDSPGRNNVKVRRERRVQSLLPDIARRRKAELENPFATQGREGSIVPSQERSRQGSIVLSGRNRERSVIASDERSRQGSMVPSERSRQDTREGSLIPPPSTTLEIQTKEVVKQTVIAALRLHSISPSDKDYKPLINQTVNSTMFALRGRFRVGKSVGMGEIGSIVEGLLEIFQPS